MFLGFGTAFVYIGQDYRMGTARSMGPAFFPVYLGTLLLLVGAATLIRGVVSRRGEGLGRFALKEALLILGGTVLYGVLLRVVGLPIALAVMIIVGGLASIHFRWGPFLLLAIGLSTFCALIFIKGLGLPIPLLGWLLQR